MDKPELKVSVVTCKYCNDSINIDMTKNDKNSKQILDFWDSWHSGCRKRLEEQNILKQMRAKKKFFIYEVK